jgi:Flp pilus assembly pilin Flp
MLISDRAGKQIARFLSDDCGQDAVEYAMLLGVIVTAAATFIQTISAYVTGIFTSLSSSL